MNEANLTRFGPKIFEREQGKPTTYSATFRAIDGPAKLVLRDDGIDNAWIKVNGSSVVEPKDFGGNDVSGSTSRYWQYLLGRSL